MIKKYSLKKGMTLAEILVVVGILGIIMLAISSFQLNIFTNNKFSQDSLSSAQDARTILRVMTKELRSASLSSNGSYAIASAGTSTISFFSDIDGDGIKEQLRYFIIGMTLKRGLVKPSGSPLVYNPATEVVTILAYNMKNVATNNPLFEYFDENYAGTSTPLSMPVAVTNVKLVKINLLIDADPLKSPIIRHYTSQVSLRNLKDNL